MLISLLGFLIMIIKKIMSKSFSPYQHTIIIPIILKLKKRKNIILLIVKNLRRKEVFHKIKLTSY